MIGEELCTERLSEPLCLGIGFEGLDFFSDALVGSAARPFGFGRQWLGDVWETAELEAEFRGSQAFAAVVIALSRGVLDPVAILAGEVSVAEELKWPPILGPVD